MCALEEFDVSSRIVKRAQYEAFDFTVQDEGVLVRNESHADPSEHEYLVRMANGLPMACPCPADQHHEHACKHRVAIAIREPVLNAATERSRLVTDGGVQASLPAEAASEPDDEECEDCTDEFPCWECVRTGEREIPE